MATSYIDEKIMNAVRRTVSGIENQHSIFLSVLLSVLLSIACSRIIEVLLIYNTITLLNLLLLFIIALLISSLLVVGFYLLFRGGYSSTFTLVFDISRFPGDWKELFRNIITNIKSKSETYNVYNENCREHVEHRDGVNYEYLICNLNYKGSIPLKIKMYFFKPATVIPLIIVTTVTIIANPLRVIVEELCSTPLLNKLRSLRKKEYYMELDIWYEVVEDLSFYFDDVEKILLHMNILLKDIIY